MIKLDFDLKEKIEEKALVLEQGAYVCKIVSVENVEEKQYLLIKLDVAEGKLKDYAVNIEKRTGNDWNYIKYYCSYKSSAKVFFKKFMLALEQSNDFKIENWNGDEKSFINLKLGVILKNEVYKNKLGTNSTKLGVDKIVSVDEIHKMEKEKEDCIIEIINDIDLKKYGIDKN